MENNYRVSITQGIIVIQRMDDCGKLCRWSLPITRPDLLADILNSQYRYGFDQGLEAGRAEWLAWDKSH